MRIPYLRLLRACAVLLGTATIASAAIAERPNVVVILADDLGYADIGAQGATDIPTPNIDRIARNGIRCTEGYVCWPACAPSRAGLLTGRDPHRFGFYTNPTPILAKDQGLPPDVRTFPQVLQKRGYVTGAIGKWHLGSTPDRHPNRMGFSEWLGFIGGAHDYFPWSHYRRPLPARPWPEHFINQTWTPIDRNGTPVTWDGYLTDLFSANAVDFVHRNRAKPFFLYLAYNAPHTPYEAPPDELEKLSLERMASIPGIPAERRRIYAAMITRMDAGIGRVLDALAETRIEERTLIIFLSDNGGGNNLDRNGRPNYPSSNHPLRGYKGELREGGIRVPFLIAWKGRLPAGITYDHPVSALDIGPTILALSGGAAADLPSDGVDLLPYLEGRTRGAPHDRLYWKVHDRGAIRDGRYKLHTSAKPGRVELYDLESDLAETTNLSAQLPEVTRRLDAAWQRWNAEMKPPLWKTPPQSEWSRPEYQPPLGSEQPPVARE